MPAAAGNFYLLNGIQEGTAKYNRIGDRIRMKSIQLFAKWVARSTTPTTVTKNYGRIAIIYDRRPGINAATNNYPALQDIFRVYDQQGASGAANAWQPPNPNNSDRFLIIRDCKWYFSNNDPANTNWVANFMMNNTFIEGSECNLYRKLNGLETQFLSNADPMQVSNIGSGALYLLIWGNGPDTEAAGSLEWSWRLRYYDY